MVPVAELASFRNEILLVNKRSKTDEKVRKHFHQMDYGRG